MSHATKHLLRSDYTFNSLTLTGTPEETALGAYLYDLINKVSASGRGKSKRQLDKTSRCLVRNDPPICGQFRMDVSDPDFGHMFTSKAFIR